MNPASKTGTDTDDKKGSAMEFAAVLQKGAAGTVSQRRDCHSSASLCTANLYPGYITAALREYYTYSRDIEGLDALVGQSDHFCHHILIRDPQGRAAGWTHVFADYWGPYTWEDAKNPDGTPGCHFTGSCTFVTDALGGVYHPTGRQDLMEICREADAAIPHGTFMDDMIGCLRMAVAHPKTDQTPPAAVTDLVAEALGGGKVKLTWTAPGGDGAKGQAAWYQVKWSPAPIVELTKGWPDKAEPLPATSRDWHARAKAFNAKQRAFWAAHNLSGAPKPGVAGAKEGMIVEGPPAGTAHFAIKSWDAASNASGLSNVVKIMVE